MGSYGYHGDDGKKFIGSGMGEDYGECKPWCPRYQTKEAHELFQLGPCHKYKTLPWQRQQQQE